MHRRLPDELGKRPRWMGEVEWGFSLTLGYIRIHMYDEESYCIPAAGRQVAGGYASPKTI